MRGNALRRDGTRFCDGGNTDIAQRDSGFWWFRRSAGWSDSVPTINLTCEMKLSLEQTTEVGAYCESALKPRQTGKAQGGQAKTPNRTWEIRLYGIIGGPRETWSWRKCEPTLQPKGQGWQPSAYNWRARALSRPLGKDTLCRERVLGRTAIG